jgi:WD40 repeat protein
MLSDLPFEILTEIAVHLPTASCLRSLSLTCQRLHEFVEKEGFRTFVQTRFPSIETPPRWNEAAQALTSTSKAWDRRALVARELLPYNRAKPKGRTWHRQSGQTMGYVPVIDSYEVFEGGKWSDTKETVVWGAGAEIVMRLRRPMTLQEKGQDAEDRFTGKDVKEVEWKIFRDQSFQDGIDDITSIHILRPHQRSNHPDEERLIVGRARGQLDLLVLKPNTTKLTHVAAYFTGSKTVRSADLSQQSHPLLAACLSDLGLLLYEAHDSEDIVHPATGITVSTSGERARTWTTKFLSSDKLAIGLGPTADPLHVYQVTPSTISAEPIRKFKAEGESTSSVYAVAPLPASSRAGGSEGDLFLSGWYNSHIKLHDLRSPSAAVTIFADTVDSSPVYSLLPMGHERFLAGAGRDALLKVFDLRLPSGRQYSYQSIQSPTLPSTDSNFFVRADPTVPARHSPTYALNTPSATSSTIYLGLESTVVSLDLVTTENLTRQPLARDVFLHGNSHTRPLAGYERPKTSTAAVELLEQEDVMRYLEPRGNFAARYMKAGANNECVKGWDCRWRPTGDDWPERAPTVRSRAERRRGFIGMPSR